MELQTLFWNAELTDIVRGYIYNKDTKMFTCLICGETFHKDMVYPVDKAFYTAKKMTEHHLVTEHDGMFNHIIQMNKSYTSISDNQKNVLLLIHQGLSDRDISKQLGLTSSTIRNYRFKFREKEKQAKIFLALMQTLNTSEPKPDEAIITPHLSATQIDDRYNITEQDKIKVLDFYFDDAGRLLEFPRKEKKKIILLTSIATNFKPKRIYSEVEINRVLKRIYDDHVILRRYLIQYGFLDRNNDGSQYWVK